MIRSDLILEQAGVLCPYKPYPMRRTEVMSLHILCQAELIHGENSYMYVEICHCFIMSCPFSKWDS